MLSPTDAASQEPVVSSAQRVVVARVRAPRDAAVQHCLEYLGPEHLGFELEGSARSAVTVVSLLCSADWAMPTGCQPCRNKYHVVVRWADDEFPPVSVRA